MKYINTFKTHASYEEKLNGGGVEISLPNVSYCEDVKDVHYTPYNLVRFYVGEITGTTPQTVNIYTDSSTSVDVQVSEGNKWYSYVLPKDKGLYQIYGDSVEKVVVKADISYNGGNHMYPPARFIPETTIEASFKGSNTSNITSMYGMFDACNLTSLDVSSFDTSNVTDMKNTFTRCGGLESLDVSSFDTSKVTDMNGMFEYCSSLESLDLSGWDISKVTDMGYMFIHCSGLTSLDLRNFNTSNVTNMNSMFSSCTSLNSLDLSGWDTSKVTNMGNMFMDCNALKTIRMVGCTTETRTKIEEALTAARIKNNVTIVTA